jgi:mono/diheme cytochrome c family protein
MRFSTIMTVFSAIAVTAAVVILFFSGGSGQSNAPQTPVDHGKRLFRLQGCASCHAIGGGITRGPDLAGVIPRLRVRLETAAYRSHIEGIRQARPELYAMSAADYAFILEAEGDERVRRWFLTHLRNPRFDNLESQMPSFQHLTPQQVEDLTAFIFTLQ